MNNIRVSNYYENETNSMPIIIFLNEFVESFASKCEDFYKRLNHAPILYGERQMSTFILPVLDKTMDVVLAESPVKRNWQENFDNAHGWVDYWCTKDNVAYYIELKMGWVNYNSQLTKKEIEKWIEACNQLESINTELQEEKEYFDDVYKIVLHILPIYKSYSNVSKRIEMIDYSHNVLFEMHKSMINQFKESVRPNWCATWSTIETDILGLHVYKLETEFYPGVLFMARIDRC